jgi:hypothetical protein
MSLRSKNARDQGGRTRAATPPAKAVTPATRRRWWPLLAATVFALSVCAPTWASEVVGSVIDVSGQPVVGARVEVLNAQGKPVATGITNATGVYSITNLPVGDYTLRLAGVVGGSAPAANSAEVDTSLPAQGETVNWTMAANGSAIAMQQAGVPGNQQQGVTETGVSSGPAPYGAGLTEMGATRNAGAGSMGTTTNFAASSSLPAVAAGAASSTPATPKPASPSS